MHTAGRPAWTVHAGGMLDWRQTNTLETSPGLPRTRPPSPQDLIPGAAGGRELGHTRHFWRSGLCACTRACRWRAACVHASLSRTLCLARHIAFASIIHHLALVVAGVVSDAFLQICRLLVCQDYHAPCVCACLWRHGSLLIAAQQSRRLRLCKRRTAEGAVSHQALVDNRMRPRTLGNGLVHNTVALRRS
jgi:hypothetical protein